MSVRISDTGSSLHIFISYHGVETELPAMWLRERTRSRDEVDETSGQRLINLHTLSEDLAVISASLNNSNLFVEFSDGSRHQYPLSFLLEQLNKSADLPAAVPWRANLSSLPRVDYVSLGQDDVLLKALHDFLSFGFIVIDAVPTKPGTIEKTAQRFGHVRETNFGRIFEVYARSGSNDLAYRDVALGPHTDNPYRDPVPGIQLLHCLENDVSGGHSTLVDGLAAGKDLQAEDPAGYQLLTEVLLRFEFNDSETSLITEKPLILSDDRGQMTGLCYSPKLDYMPLLSVVETRLYQRARRRLAEMLISPEYELQFRLRPGQLMMFDNNRVLHGRTRYDGNEGARHLQGCYIDVDAPSSQYRVLTRKLRQEELA